MSAGLILAGAASAQDMAYYTSHSTLKDLKVMGGFGPEGADYRSASWSGTEYVTASSGEEIVANFSCLGMDQPAGSLFDRHVTCDYVSDSGGEAGSLIAGCMTETEDGGEMSCTGYFQGKTGELEGHVALVTEYYKFSEDGGTTTSTGQWIR